MGPLEMNLPDAVLEIFSVFVEGQRRLLICLMLKYWKVSFFYYLPRP